MQVIMVIMPDDPEHKLIVEKSDAFFIEFTRKAQYEEFRAYEAAHPSNSQLREEARYFFYLLKVTFPDETLQKKVRDYFQEQKAATMFGIYWGRTTGSVRNSDTEQTERDSKHWWTNYD